MVGADHGAGLDWPPMASLQRALVGGARACLTEPELRGLQPDDPAFTQAHRRILARKPLAQRLFSDFCRRCLAADERYFDACRADTRIELGSGSGIMRRVDPCVITSEVKLVPYVDLIARGEELPFGDARIRGIYAINVFHHVSDPRVFFREITRVLAPGGGLVMIEPYYGPLARIVFRYLFTQESYELDPPGWPTHGRQQVASDANQALSYVVLRRDRAAWQAAFPLLELVLDEPHTHARYVLSGGVNFRQLVPDGLGLLMSEAERWLNVLNPLLALQHTIVIRKRLGPAGPARSAST